MQSSAALQRLLFAPQSHSYFCCRDLSGVLRQKEFSR